MIDARIDRYAAAERRPVNEHLDDWTAHLTAKSVTPKQVELATSRARLLLDMVGATRLSDMSASAVQAAIGELHRAGKSLQTCQHYLRAIKQFSRWLKRDGRIREDMLAHLTGYAAATDRRYERRALDADELRWLIATTEAGPRWRHSLSGVDRAMLYRVAVGTGFRAGELASLKPSSFQLDGSPFVTLEARKSKRRRADVQPISPNLP